MASAVPIYEHNDFYAPAFEVRVGGKDVSQVIAHDVISVSYTDNVEDFDSFDLTINNWDDSQRGQKTAFKYMVEAASEDADFFDFDEARVELWLGYQGPNPLVKMLTGRIESIEPHYPAGGSPTLTIRVLNPLKKLCAKQNSKTYIDRSNADIAREIAGRLNLDIDIQTHKGDDDQAQPYVIQDNVYDILFLYERARAMGYELLLLESSSGSQKLYFGPSLPDDTAPPSIYRLDYQRSLIEFSPRLSIAQQVGAVRVQGRDHENKATFLGEAKRSEIGLNADLDAVLGSSLSTRVESIHDHPVHLAGQAKQLAREVLRRIMQNMVTAQFSMPGLPDIRAGRTVEVTGVGSRFEGPYFITSTTHTLDDNGYRTGFSARREKYS
jgi:phage protein D